MHTPHMACLSLLCGGAWATGGDILEQAPLLAPIYDHTTRQEAAVHVAHTARLSLLRDDTWPPQEVTFTFNTVGWSKHHSTDRPVHLFLHLSIDQWRADLMASTPEGNFITHRMLPPGRTWFFFSEGELPNP